MKTDKRRKLKPEEHLEIIRRRRQGEASAVLAEEFGISRKTVYDLFRQSLFPKARFSRRQLNKYLELLGKKPPNVQEIVDGKKKPAQKPAKKNTRKTTGKTVHTKTLNPAIWRQIIKRYKKHENVDRLAEDFGLSSQALLDGIERHTKFTQRQVPMTLQHLEWLKEQIMPGGRRGTKKWSQTEVRHLLSAKFRKRISLRTFHSQLAWMGIDSKRSQKPGARREAMREEHVRQHEKNEQIVLAALKSGRLKPIVRGRAKGWRKNA